jgi:NADP-reducing hydrogenase subunit HndD
LKDKKFDPALGISSGAGVIFGASGGVMEAALRTAVEEITGAELGRLEFEMVRGEEGIRCAEIEIGDLKLRVAVAHEIRNAKKILEDLKSGKVHYDFIEVMACPNGCIGGGGQPMPTNPMVRRARIKGVMDRDKGMPIRKSHENPVVKKIYKEFLGKPGGEKAEEFFHTKYINRKE